MASVATKSSTVRSFQRTFQKGVQDSVIPRFWTGSYNVVDPGRFRIDAGGRLTKEDLKESSALGQEIQEKYNDVGAVHIHNTGLTDMADQRMLAQIVMGDETEYEGGANPRERLDVLDNAYDTGAPPEASLHYHHEMGYKSHSIEMIGFLCKWTVTARPGVGWTFLSDSVQSHDLMMETELGQKLKEKGVCHVMRMTDANAYTDRDASSSYNHWQRSWMTDDPAEAQAAADEQNVQIKWIEHPTEGLSMETRFYQTGFEYIPFLDRNILLTGVGDGADWFDSWPGIAHIPHGQRPLDLTFGDDTPISLEERQLWADIFDHCGIPIEWAPGDVAVCCNMRFAHGRPSIELLPGEKRELGVMLGPLYKREGPRADKW